MNSEDDHTKWMREAIEEAKIALEIKEVPVGCVIVYNNEQIIGKGFNQTNILKNPLRHAEFEAFDQVKQWCVAENNRNEEDVYNKSILYVTCEPCIMCAGAIRRMGIRTCVYGCDNERFGGCGTVANVANNNISDHGFSVTVIKSVCGDISIQLLQTFYTQENPFAPKPKIKQNHSKKVE